jgi:uncharacterized membrane protein
MKIKKTFYWITTIFLCIAMLAGGIQQMLQIGGYVDIVVNQLGYPKYFLSIIGTWKVLGVIALLLPGFPRIKEWAYAGFFFVMSGALISHIAMKQSFGEMMPSIILLMVIIASYFLWQAKQKLSFNQHNPVQTNVITA